MEEINTREEDEDEEEEEAEAEEEEEVIVIIICDRSSKRPCCFRRGCHLFISTIVKGSPALLNWHHHDVHYSQLEPAGRCLLSVSFAPNAVSLQQAKRHL